MEKSYSPFLEKTKYTILVVLQIMTMCAGFAFAVPYLQNFQINDSICGIIIGISCAIAIIANPFIGKIADKSLRFDAKTLVIIFAFSQAVFSVILFFIKNPIIQCVFYTLILSLVLMIAPLVNSIGFSCTEKTGIHMNYGIARGLGSAAYAISAAFLGYMIKDVGTFVIPFAIFILAVFEIVISYLISVNHLAKTEVVDSNTLRFKEYPSFFLVIIGFSLIMISYNMIGTYLIRIIENVGGTSQDLGVATAIAAIAEVPALLLYTRLSKHISSYKILVFSGFVFLLKVVFFIFAQSILAIYVIQLLQVLSYGLYAAARVYYAEETLPNRFRTRGQVYACMTESLGMIGGSVIGGIIVSGKTSTTMLTVSSIICGFGLLWLILSLFIKRKPSI